MRFNGLSITFTDLNAVCDLIKVNDFIRRIKIEKALNPVQRIVCNLYFKNQLFALKYTLKTITY